ncbi:uncharacterized protein LOC144743090 [Ciona intestinalis]
MNQLVKKWFTVLIVAFVIVLTIVFLEKIVWESKEPLNSEKKQQQEVITQFKGQLLKSTHAKNYTIRKTLPVLVPIICGVSAKKREYDESGKKYKVPNIVHLVRIGDMAFDALMYLTLRSMASIQQPEVIYIYYTTTIPTSKFAERANKEIPCLQWIKVEDPEYVNGVHLTVKNTRTDIVRFTKLLEHGGIYVDNDVILLKSFDPLRHYSFVAGREHTHSINDGIMLVEQNSDFANKFYHESYLKALENYDPQIFFKYAQDGLYEFYRQHMGLDVHIEEFAFNRPLPFDGYEGFGAAISSHYDLSENYVLHIHPGSTIGQKPELKYIHTDTEEEVRTRDNIYGAAARIAYFGSPDLIFRPGEKVYNRAPTIKLKPLPKIEPDNENSSIITR